MGSEMCIRDRNIQDLKQLLDQAEQRVKPLSNEQATVPRVQDKNVQAVPRVQEVQRVQHSTASSPTNCSTPNQRVTRTTAFKSRTRRRNHSHSPQVFLPTQPPAHSTRSKVREASKVKSQTKTAAPNRSSRLMQPTKSSIHRNTRQALSATLQSPTR